MKTFIVIIAGLVTTSLWTGCKPQDRYLDLSTGDRVDLEKDSSTGLMVRTDTKKPVEIYVDTKTNDTIYGPTGKVINGHVVRGSDNVYWYDVDYDNEYKAKSSDYKMEVEKDGDITIKDGDTKTKIDGKTGEKKVKKD